MENPVKKKLREGKPVVGATITVPSAEIAVTAAACGYDFLWIEMEHTAITLESARNMILATRGTNTVPFIRVPAIEHWMVKRALDIGALGVILPFTNTPELARRAVEACRYPPAGDRGFGPTLAAARWPEAANYADFADENVVVVAVIERAIAVEQIDEIAATPGLDVMFIGPADLSFSLGLRGNWDAPVERDAIARILAAAQRHNVVPGIAVRAADIPARLEQGFRFLQTPSELRLMADGARAVFDALGRGRDDGRGAPIY